MNKLIDIMIECGAATAAPIKYESCEIINQNLASKLQFTPKSVCIGTLPYYTKFCDNDRSVSSYALAYDYHLYIQEIGKQIISKVKETYPENNFICFGDHSPINEKLAAAKAGLGIIGEHSLLITPDFSSFVFLFEIISDIECDQSGREIKHCERCGRCKAACPANIDDKTSCLSAITQKKGVLSESESELIRSSSSAWGCDICQQVCPHTISAKSRETIYTKSLWFNRNILNHPTAETINDASDFESRAYSWRGKETILRNLNIINPEKR